MTEPVSDPKVFDTPSTDTLELALVRIFGEVETIKRDAEAEVQTKSGGRYSYQYLTLDALLSMLRPIVARHGCYVMQVPIVETDEHGITRAGCHTFVVHGATGERHSARLLFSVGDDSPQVVGSAITYARRYTLGPMFGIAAEEDDDAQGAQKRPPAPRAAAPPAEVAKRSDEELALNLDMPLGFGRHAARSWREMMGDKKHAEYLGWLLGEKPTRGNQRSREMAAYCVRILEGLVPMPAAPDPAPTSSSPPAAGASSPASPAPDPGLHFERAEALRKELRRMSLAGAAAQAWAAERLEIAQRVVPEGERWTLVDLSIEDIECLLDFVRSEAEAPPMGYDEEPVL
jgi:hypothetical protein